MHIAAYRLRNEKWDKMRDADGASSTPNSGPQTSNSKGFTLIEIVITIVLVSILAALASVIILQGVKAYSDEDSRSDVHYQARLAVERIVREARQMQSCATITVTSSPTGTLWFTDINGTPVKFSVSGGKLWRNDTDLLASGITSTQPFSFSDNLGNSDITCDPNPSLSIWFIDVSVTNTVGTQSLQIRSRVHPRMF
jgi:prepilin-type N-terminal cleavage/methylation domain-containing protein